MVYIIKRDGRKVPFEREKIERAVLKAFAAVDGELTDYAISKAEKISEYIENICQNKELSIEEIQDYVENGLMSTKRHDVAKAYITYREERTRKRKTNSELIKMVREKLQSVNVENQNANLDEYSFGGRMGEASSVVMRDIALNEIMSDKARENHLKNRIYTHDLNHYAVGDHNCLTVPFDKLLASGFNTRQTDVRPANSVRTAFQLIAVLFQIQSLQQFGGVSASHLDWSMVPYVRKSFTKHLANGLKYIEKVSEYKAVRFDKWLKHDSNHPDGTIHLDDEEFKKLHPAAWEYAMDMLKEELKQSAEGMYHNLNTLQSRSGNQLPFTSINYGTCTLLEGQLVTEALLDALIAGVGKYHRTSIFPCGIFQFMIDVNDREGTPNYYLFRKSLQATAKRLYPNYANVNWSGNAGFDINDPSTYFSTMGCRTANGWDINGLGQKKDGRGNICPVTIIMPTLAMEAKEYAEANGTDIIETFLKILEEAISDAKDILIERFEWICAQPMEAARFMYENGTMEGYVPEEGIRSALKHGTLAIGQIGLAETLEILVGCNHTKKKGMELAHRIESMFKELCAQYKNKYKLNFGVYYTPAENLCYTALKKFRAQYGVIPRVSDRDYFTNSIHVPVWEKLSPFEKINIESQLTGYSSAGCITYVELEGRVLHNIDALEQLVVYAMKKDIPYFALNVPADLCMDCGYEDLIENECPVCGSSNVQRLRRVTGYLTGDYKSAFNLGKQAEVEDRYKHSNKMEFDDVDENSGLNQE